MKSLYAAVVMTVCLAGQSASACFYFPYMPFAGHSAWGAGYAPVNYGYASYGYASYGGGCCDTGCGVYSASYQSYGNAGCSTCGDCCSGTCGSTFSHGANYGGCSNCGSDCIGTESRKIPEPDSEYNKDAPTRKYGPADDRDLSDGFDAREPSRPRNDSDYETEAERTRRLERERLDRDLDRTDRERPNFLDRDPGDWNPAGPGSAPTERSRFEDPADLGRGRTDNLTDPMPSDAPFTDRFNNKPPMPEPSDMPPPVDHDVRKPAMPPIEEGIEAEDFLPPEPAEDARTSHADVLKMPRLAEHTRTRTQTTSKVSSSQSKQAPARWISLPLPAGRARS